MTARLAMNDLRLNIDGHEILKGVDLTLSPGAITGLVGRSGSGKSLTAYSAMNLLPRRARASGEILFDKRNLLALDDRDMSALRGRRLSMIFQEPMSALNPLQPIDRQVAEVLRIHTGMDSAAALDAAYNQLERVGLDPERVPAGRRPDQLSGGQRQRVIIAMATIMKPDVILADEPTTALDSVTQADVLALLKKLVKKDGAAMLLISHDLGAVASIADDIAIMKDGRIVDAAPTSALPRLSGSDTLADLIGPTRHQNDNAAPSPDETAGPVLAVRDLDCHYYAPPQTLFGAPKTTHAVRGVSFSVNRGECLAIVGESGSGKSTLARALVGLDHGWTGRIEFHDDAINKDDSKAWRRVRRSMQLVFQDPFTSFNPRWSVRDIVAEPLHLLETAITAGDRVDRVSAALSEVGLDPDCAARRPGAFSGGQRQRIAIARALIVRPELLILDEATSALDIAARNRVIDILCELKRAYDMALIVITHDLSVARAMADRIAVMQAGQFVETGSAQTVLSAPQHAYTKRLADASRVIELAFDKLRANLV